MKRLIIIHYSELGLKKGNRDYFEKRLCRNIDNILAGCGVEKVQRISGRLLLNLETDSAIDEVKRRLGLVFGIAYFGEGWMVEWEIETLSTAVWELVKDLNFDSFRIDTRRPDKRFPLNSMEVNRRVGGYVQERSGARVDLTAAAMVCRIELVEGRALISAERINGLGGLPSYTGGKVAVLLSGGIDSPVAAWRIMRRGCNAFFIHFHSFPHTNKESQEKAKQVAGILAMHQRQSRICLVPFADIQRRIMVETPMETRVILYRRYMFRLAEILAKREKARALVTGDSLGQVASQTLENIDVISRAISMPVLRPLIANDKEEIISIARRIGTYEISILPDQDCCSLFVPKHPETRANLRRIERIEHNLDLSVEIEAALASAEVLVQYPTYETGAVPQL
jgi:thiamine biosynthesis protein ThiI